MAKVVGVASCPAGVAHTYMAAEAIQKAGERLGHEVRMETQGAGGTENKLTEQEIEQADLVVVAADINVDESRFAGKRLVRMSAGAAIKGADKMFRKVLPQ